MRHIPVVHALHCVLIYAIMFCFLGGGLCLCKLGARQSKWRAFGVWRKKRRGFQHISSKRRSATSAGGGGQHPRSGYQHTKAPHEQARGESTRRARERKVATLEAPVADQRVVVFLHLTTGYFLAKDAGTFVQQPAGAFGGASATEVSEGSRAKRPRMTCRSTWPPRMS